MTVSPQSGFPDWQGYPQWGASLVNQRLFTATASQTLVVAASQSPNWSSILIRCIPTSGSGTLQVSVYPPGDTPANGQIFQWNLTSGGPGLDVVVPTHGQTVQVELIEGTGTASFKAYVAATMLNTPSAKPIYVTSANYSINDNVTAPAGGAYTATLPGIASGRLLISINKVGSATLSDVELQVLAANGTWGPFILLDQAVTTPRLYDLALPGVAVRLFVVNNATTAITGLYVSMWTDTD